MQPVARRILHESLQSLREHMNAAPAAQACGTLAPMYCTGKFDSVLRSLPAGHDAAVDWKNDASDEARLIRREEQQGLGDIGRLTVTAERVHRVEGRKYLGDLLGREEGVEHRRLNDRGCDRVHADLVGCQLDCEILN